MATKKTKLAFLSASAVVLLLAGCKPSASAPKAAGGPPPVPVQTAVAQQADVPRAIESVGAVQALRTVAVKSQVDGMIARIHFKEGDDVKAGDLLVTLDQRPFENSLRIARADLANAKAESAKAEADLGRYKSLDQQDAISKEQFAQLVTKGETTRAAVQAKEAAVANAELLLGYTQIRAPIAGRTGQLILHEGALVKANDVSQSIVTLNQLAPIAAAFSVPESSLGAIRAALADGSASVTVIDRSSGIARTDGKLTFVDNSVDPTTGTITLKAIFENTDYKLWPGQFVQVQTQTGLDRGALVVPASAVQNGQSGSMVYVVNSESKAELRAVKVIRAAGDQLLLAEGVRSGETVVTDGQLRLLPGSKVEAKNLSTYTPHMMKAGEEAKVKPGEEPKS
jgi:multidrug efflux system membrane fusion protein